MAITSCHEDPSIGLWMAMLGINQLLVRWQGYKGLSTYWNNRSEETIRSCDGYREVVLGVITSLPEKLFNHFRVLPAQEQSELLVGAALPWMSKCNWQDTHKARMITKETMWRV